MSTPLDAQYETIPVEVIDDLTSYAFAQDVTHQVGAVKLLTYVLHKRNARRREQTKGPVTPAKGVKRG